MDGIANSATIGIQNDTGNSGLQMSYNTDYAENNLTTSIKKNPAWAGINQINNFEYSGELLAGNSTILDIRVENADLVEGIYNASLNITSNASSLLSFPITLVSTTEILLGDLNGDSIINVVDVVQLVNIALGLYPEITAADVNEDGVVNVLDVIQLVNLILG